jgi:hypothetical protein
LGPAFVLVVLFGLALFGVARAWIRAAPWLRRLSEAPRCLAGTVREGLVRVDGVAECARTLTSPAHRAACIGYSVKVEELVRRGKSSTWVTRHEDSEILPFDVVDSSGRARVEVGPDTTLEFLREPVVHQDLFNALPEHVESWVRGLGVELEGTLLRKGMRVREWRLDAGETCLVIGEGGRVTDPAGASADYREAPTRSVIRHGAWGLFVADRSGESLRRDLRRRLAWRSAVAVLPLAGLVAYALLGHG